MLDFIITNIFHITGILCVFLFVVGLHFKSNIILKKTMTVTSLITALNMLANEQYSGAIINCINFFRNILSFAIDIQKIKHILFVFFISIYLTIQFFLEDKYWYLPFFASSLGLIALFYFNGFKTRLILFFGTVIWFSYAILHQNIYSIVLEIFVIISFLSSLFFHKFDFKD
jgi:hypothetical protein